MAQDAHRLVGGQDAAHQVGQIRDADHFIGAHVVSLAGAALIQKGEEPMGQVGLIEVGAEGRAIAENR
ncbi:MAG: hypothetical protein ACK55I_41515, partial [bacterium]